VTLTSDGGLDQGINNSNVYVSFNSTASGGGTAFIGATQLTSSPQLFNTGTGNSLLINYTAPAVLPTSGADTISVRDGGFSVGAGNSDTYSFAPATTTPTISVGNSGVFEADQEPGIPMNFTVTVSPVQTTPITISYTALCGIGDKECGEDFRQITSPKTLTIAAGAKTAILRIGQYSYVGGKSDPDAGGETYNEGLYVVISHPTLGVLGRSVGEGTLLPDLENGVLNVPDLYIGNSGIVPVADGIKRAVDFTVTLGALESSTVTFTYTTSDGSAVQGVNYQAKTGTLTIAAGKDSAVITVLLYGNAPPPSPLTFSITISNASDASGPVTIGTATGTGTIMTS
jgi:Calx-beta domain